MGGAIVDALSNVAKDAGDSFAESGFKDEISNVITRVKAKSWEFDRSEPGKDLHNVLMDYLQNKDKITQKLIDVNKTLPSEQQMHPIQLKATAANSARSLTFGRNDAVPVSLIHAARHNPAMDSASAEMHALNLADFVGSILHDTETRPIYKDFKNWSDEDKQVVKQLRKGIKLTAKSTDPNKVTLREGFIQQLRELQKKNIIGESAPYSSFKMNVVKSQEHPVNLKTYPVYSQGSPRMAKLESTMMNYGRTVVFPFVAVPHLSSILQTAISTPLLDMTKAMVDEIGRMHGGTEFGNVMKFGERAGIFAQTSYDMYAAEYYGSKNLLSKVSGNSNVGKVFYKLTHNPGFDTVRREQLAFTASAGLNTIREMAQELYESGGKSKRALYELGKTGINQADIMMQKGQLNDDQLEKAIWRFTDSKLFLHNDFQRSYYAQAFPFFRIMTMYHSYVNRMSRLLVEEAFYKPFKAGYGFGSFAQTAAVLGVTFPLAGLMTKNLGMLVRGDWDDIHFKKDLEDITFQNGLSAAMDQLVNDYSHVAAFGITTSYVRGATRYGAANAMLGPLGNVAAKGLGDTIMPGYQEYEHLTGEREKNADLKPLLRDVLEYNPAAYDNIGKIFTHTMLPTQREEAERNPKRSLKFKIKHKHTNKNFNRFGR